MGVRKKKKTTKKKNPHTADDNDALEGVKLATRTVSTLVSDIYNDDDGDKSEVYI